MMTTDGTWVFYRVIRANKHALKPTHTYQPPNQQQPRGKKKGTFRIKISHKYRLSTPEKLAPPGDYRHHRQACIHRICCTHCILQLHSPFLEAEQHRQGRQVFRSSGPRCVRIPSKYGHGARRYTAKIVHLPRERMRERKKLPGDNTALQGWNHSKITYLSMSEQKLELNLCAVYSTCTFRLGSKTAISDCKPLEVDVRRVFHNLFY